MGQLKLFEETKPIFEKKEKRIFKNLTIHERINYKANLCGFSGMVYKGNNYQGWEIENERKNPTTHLTNNYWWHYDKNCHGTKRNKHYLQRQEKTSQKDRKKSW